MLPSDRLDTDHAAYACDAKQSKGRCYPESDDELRSIYQHDRARIVHSGAFRKLTGKTQVFISHENDYYRTRLTHSLEVAQIARIIACVLRVNEDLTEAVALAHDLGHPPFGHVGEKTLNQLLYTYGGGDFNHNEQTVRILTFLERPYPCFKGLNVSWETLEGVVKHNGPFTESDRLPETIEQLNRLWSLDVYRSPSIEAQIANLADDIAYNAHDLDDGLRAHLFTIEELCDAKQNLSLIVDIVDNICQEYPKLAETQLRHTLIRQLINYLTRDVITETTTRIETILPSSVEDIRCADKPFVTHSLPGEQLLKTLKDFLYERMYRHYQLNRTAHKAQRILCDMFHTFMHSPDCLPPGWQHTLPENTQARARHITDYIAGMTDRYAWIEYRQLFDHD